MLYRHLFSTLIVICFLVAATLIPNRLLASTPLAGISAGPQFLMLSKQKVIYS